MRDGSDGRAMGGSLAVFALALAAGAAAALALAWALPGLPFPVALAAPVLPVAAVLAGRGHARRTGRPPSGTEMASFTVAATMVAVIGAVALVWAVLAWQGRAMSAQDFAVAFLRLPASPEALWRWPLFWAELAPWVVLIVIWAGFRAGARAGTARATATPG